MKQIRIVFFDAKDYDVQSFERALPAFREGHPDMPECKMKFFDTRLSEDTVNLAKGADVVCIFVNDIVDRTMAETLMFASSRKVSPAVGSFASLTSQAKVSQSSGVWIR